MGQDELTLHKASVFAQIAAAIAATGHVEVTVFNENESTAKPTGKASLERKPEPKKVTAQEPDRHTDAKEYLAGAEYKAVKNLEDEPADKHAIRYAYLTDIYGSKMMKELPEEAYGYFCPEKRVIDVFKYYLEQWHADVDKWIVKVATESSHDRVTTIAELTVEEYLNTLMPAMLHLNYVLSFAQDQEALLDVLNRVSRGQVKKLDDLRLRNIKFIRTAVDSVLNGTFDDIEKVS